MPEMRITTFDVCVPGFERLRSQREFILVAAVDGSTPFSSYREQWHSDLQCCDRGDGFDWDQAKKLIDEKAAELEKAYQGQDNPFRLDVPKDEDDEETQGYCNAYLFIEVSDG